jgi:hypothetical protein
MVLMQAGLGLRVDDVDFLRRTVRVEHQADPDTLDLVPPKTVRSRRTIPLPEVVANALAAHLAAYPPDELTGCACPAPTTCSRTRSGLLFHTSTSRPYSHDHYGGRVFPRAVTAAGLPPGTSTYDLRHHFASLPQMRGVASDATFDGSCDWAATRTWGFRLIGVAVWGDGGTRLLTWCSAVAVASTATMRPFFHWLGASILLCGAIEGVEDLTRVEVLRARLFGGSSRPTKHLGEAQTIFLLNKLQV